MSEPHRPPFPSRAWHPPTHAFLRAWLAQRSSPSCAALDWDNTCIYNDIGDATFHYQLDRLALRLAPERLQALLHSMSRPTPATDALRVDVLASYTALWPAMASGDASRVHHSPAHHDFRVAMATYYAAMEHAPDLGPAAAYPWLLNLFEGFSDAEVESLALDAWTAAAAQGIGTATWQSATGGQAGVLRHTFRTHVRAHEEMRDLVAALRQAGVAPYVVTASFEPLVRAVARQQGFAVAGVYGLRRGDADYPVTYRTGKVQVIQRFLPSAPVLCAGDADTDLEMLTGFADTAVRLIVNRNSQGEIRNLYAAALRDEKHPVTLLQGRDENRGVFVASRETIALGESAARPL